MNIQGQVSLMYLYHSMTQGRKLFDEVTAANVKKQLAIVHGNTIYQPEIKEKNRGRPF